MATIRLIRFNYTTEGSAEAQGTFGKLVLPNGRELFTCEKPWVNNKPLMSCIPEGTYILRKRRSGVVERSSKGKYKIGWEVTNVPGRTYIMFHIANWPHELLGCISVGLTYGTVIDKLGVGHSADAFDEFMGALEGEDSHTLIIDHFEP